MSLFKYGDLEREIDFTDVEFLENLDEAKKLIKEEAAKVPKVGKTADIIRAQCQCYFNFFDRVIGEGAHEEMFGGKTSLNACLNATDALLFSSMVIDSRDESMIRTIAISIAAMELITTVIGNAL